MSDLVTENRVLRGQIKGRLRLTDGERMTLAEIGQKRSPNLNCFAERWVRSAKEEMLSKLILFGEASLRRALAQYLDHHHVERPHQGKGNVILFPSEADDAGGPIVPTHPLSGDSVRAMRGVSGSLAYRIAASLSGSSLS
jgi:hypothetical protein